MKYPLSILLGISVLLSSYNIVNAKENQSVERLKRYESPEDLLISLIMPKIDKIVEKQYGKKMTVNPSRVRDIAFMVDPKGEGKPSAWYEIELDILVGEIDNNPDVDNLRLKIDTPYIGNDKVSESLKVELIKYSKSR